MMKGCPTVLSIGRLCIDNSFAFWWPWGSDKPMLLDKDYNATYFDVQDYVPMINDDPSENVEPDADFVATCIACCLPGASSTDNVSGVEDLGNLTQSKKELLMKEAKSTLHQMLHIYLVK